ncbi:EthD family reductase [Actinomadura sp. ATCC 31491]|uniref:EthD family reductase n=1 Tax=Actinomadura luzonensis TaxID=2805427 RepID=A0ABT0G7V6_9ACTN|nr:EthD domain-containing protein [Actinomadura luzonensis]MCK2220671.1 EthD family reductase [Actinomadura luzonensis]
MIHQLIFAAPRPGMTEEEFQQYWLNVHAVRYASKIPQIRKYLIDTRIPFWPEEGEPLWSGVAEIWLRDEKEQLESLQTPEFLEGARLDEPRWAAFWRTVVLDTDAHELVPGPDVAPARGVKLIVLAKRREGLPRAEFRQASLGGHAALVAAVPGVRRYLQCHVRDGAYGIGEAVLDVAHLLWFDDRESMAAALASPEYAKVQADLETLAEPRYVHRMAVTEHWVIGPEAR